MFDIFDLRVPGADAYVDHARKYIGCARNQTALVPYLILGPVPAGNDLPKVLYMGTVLEYFSTYSSTVQDARYLGRHGCLQSRVRKTLLNCSYYVNSKFWIPQAVNQSSLALCTRRCLVALEIQRWPCGLRNSRHASGRYHRVAKKGNSRPGLDGSQTNPWLLNYPCYSTFSPGERV